MALRGGEEGEVGRRGNEVLRAKRGGRSLVVRTLGGNRREKGERKGVL